ncbi:helix-turn-helix transcriptional regulator [Streptomyces sp. UNOC14_S4]|nr:helix-turn-helix transcriptional regulator [Streptomyces sp. UNOC14_S4]
MGSSGGVGPAGSLQELFGRRLRRLRERHGLTQTELGRKVPISQGRIAQFENAKELPTADVVRRLDAVLDADGELVDIWGMAGRGVYWSLADTFREAEEKAIRLYHFANMIPGIVQTEDYARAIITEWYELLGGIDIEESVKARMDRQSLLEKPNPPWLWCVVDEAALHRVVGSRAVMRTQLLRMLDLGTRPRITFQVLPFQQAIPGGFASTIVALMAMPDGRQLAYQEAGLHCGFAANPEEVSSYIAFYDHARARALPPAESADLIRTLIEEQYSDNAQL